MTDKPRSDMQQRARRARERSIAPVDRTPQVAPDPEVLKQLEVALLSMPKLRREIFLAVRLDAMSYGQIAEVTGLSVKAVERELARALSDLDHHLRHGHAPPHRHWWAKWLNRR